MNKHLGFTLIELMIGLAVVVILASSASIGMSHAIQSAHFLDLKDSASRLAIAQQNHRQVYNQFASQITTSGAPSANQLVFPDASKYRITLVSRGYNEFVADVQTRPNNPSPSDDCSIVRVRSRQGLIAFESFDKTALRNTSLNCLQNG